MNASQRLKPVTQEAWAARLKSCPDTKWSLSQSVLQAWLCCAINASQRLKPVTQEVWAARLKSCPDTKRSLSQSVLQAWLCCAINASQRLKPVTQEAWAARLKSCLDTKRSLSQSVKPCHGKTWTKCQFGGNTQQRTGVLCHHQDQHGKAPSTVGTERNAFS